MLVVDKDYTVHYRSDDTLLLARHQMRKTEKGPLMIGNKIRISGSEIRGGHVLWQEDVSDLMENLEELRELNEELRESNAVSMQNYQMEKQIRAIAEQNRLHDELHKQTTHQIELLNDWLGRLLEARDQDEKKELLRRVVVVGAYLKRRNNLFLVNEQAGMIREEELRLSIEEMMKNLQVAGIDCACLLQLDRDLPTDAAMKLFDFYEYVVERAFDGLNSLLARFFYRDGKFYACMDVVCGLDLTVLQSDTVSVSPADENCYTLSFCVEGGVGA